MSELGRLLRERGLPLSAQPTDNPSWYREAEKAAPLAVLGLINPLRVGRPIIGRPHPSEPLVGNHCRHAAEALETDVARCEHLIARLLDERMDAGDSARDIRRAVVALIDRQSDAVGTVVHNAGWDHVVRDRVRAWKWRNSPRGRRVLAK